MPSRSSASKARRRGREPNNQSRSETTLAPRLDIGRIYFYHDAAQPPHSGSTGPPAFGRRRSHRSRPVDELLVARVAVRGERNEPWTLSVTHDLRTLDDEAAGAGLDLELALRLATEAALVCSDLIALDVSLEAIDEVAAGAAVSGAVDPCHAAYLRRLTTSPPRAPRALDALIVAGLPTRLSTRLLAVDLAELIKGTSLSRARSWEIAAVLDGRTISEWASLTALGLARR